jgi:hypothetical protein
MPSANWLPHQTGNTTTSSQMLTLCRTCHIPSLGSGVRCPLCGSVEVVNVNVCWIEDTPNTLRQGFSYPADSGSPQHAPRLD